MSRENEKAADELTSAEALEVFDGYENAIRADLEVKTDGVSGRPPPSVRPGARRG